MFERTNESYNPVTASVDLYYSELKRGNSLKSNAVEGEPQISDHDPEVISPSTFRFCTDDIRGSLSLVRLFSRLEPLACSPSFVQSLSFILSILIVSSVCYGLSTDQRITLHSQL